jgi:hypothetical protein
MVDQAGQLIGDQASQRRLRGQLESPAERAQEIDEDIYPDRARPDDDPVAFGCRSGWNAVWDFGDVMAPPGRTFVTRPGVRRYPGHRALRYWPVIFCSGGPAASTEPPREPPSGPRSMTQSAVLITSRLCSITMTVLPGVDQPGQHAEQLADVLEVQAGGRLVQHVDGPAGGPALQFGGELDALRLAAGQGGRGLAQPDVAQAHVDQRLEVPVDRGHRREELRASSIGMSRTSAIVLPL